MTTPTPQLKAKLKKIVEATQNSENINEKANAVEVLKRVCEAWDIEMTPETVYSYGLLSPSSQNLVTKPIMSMYNAPRTRQHHHTNFG